MRSVPIAHSPPVMPCLRPIGDSLVSISTVTSGVEVSLGNFVLVYCFLAILAGPFLPSSWAQELAPRAYLITPLHADAITLTWSFYMGPRRVLRRMVLHDESQFLVAQYLLSGTRSQSQNPIVALEGHLSYDFTPRLWISLDGNFWHGGKQV